MNIIFFIITQRIVTQLITQFFKMTILDRYSEEKNFSIQKMDGIDFRMCKDLFVDAKHLFKQYNEVYYLKDTYEKKKNTKDVRRWNANEKEKENMYKGTVANFDKLYQDDDINIEESEYFIKKIDSDLTDGNSVSRINLENIPRQAKIDYMIRKIGGTGRYQQVFVHKYVAIDMAMSLSPNFKAIVISIFSKEINHIISVTFSVFTVSTSSKSRPSPCGTGRCTS